MWVHGPPSETLCARVLALHSGGWANVKTDLANWVQGFSTGNTRICGRWSMWSGLARFVEERVFLRSLGNCCERVVHPIFRYLPLLRL